MPPTPRVPWVGLGPNTQNGLGLLGPLWPQEGSPGPPGRGPRGPRKGAQGPQEGGPGAQDGAQTPRGRKDAQGLHDIWGNVSEYAVKPDGTYVVMGGSFIDPAKDVSIDYSVPFTIDWNKDDPQIPKSPWWMASNDWVGIRVVCDPE